MFKYSIQLKQINWFSYMVSVGTTPPSDTWHAFLSGLAPSGFPQKNTWRAFPIRTPSGRNTRHSQISHPDDCHITSGRPTYPIWICLSESLTKSKQVLLHQSDSLPQPTIHRLQSKRTGLVAGHLPPSAVCRVKGQEWWHVTSQDLW